jgi:hypothetical protein
VARFLAFHSAPNLTKETFTEALREVRNWRPDPRTTVIKVYYSSEDGKLISECEAARREDFEAWLSSRGWAWDNIYKVSLIAQTGNIWEL